MHIEESVGLEDLAGWGGRSWTHAIHNDDIGAWQQSGRGLGGGGGTGPNHMDGMNPDPIVLEH